MDWYICDSNDSSSILEEHVRTSILFRKYLFVQSVAQWVSFVSRWSYIREIERTRKKKSLFYFCFISALFKNWRCVNAIFQLQSCSVKFTLFNYIFEYCEFQGFAWYLFRHGLFFHLDHVILQNFLILKYLKHAMTNLSNQFFLSNCTAYRVLYLFVEWDSTKYYSSNIRIFWENDK